LFSSRAGVELGKQVLKLLVLSVIGYLSLHGIVMAVAARAPVSLAPLLGYATSSLLGFIRTTAVIGLALGVGDYFIQRHRVQTSIKMTKQEVLDERKSQEGDPIIRSQLRRRQWSIARSKTLAAVKTADVVVTNPTHVAVALQYVSQRGGAPRVVAKGLDSLAERIKEEAAKHTVPICEDPPLARYLYATCKVEDSIPLAVYTAVARLIAFVYSLSPGARGMGVHRRAYSVVPDIEDDARLPDTETVLLDG
jgi:flagellar biosynthetic protein FlhB